MSKESSLNIEKPFDLFGISLYGASVIVTTFQVLLCTTLGVLYPYLLGHSPIVSIVFAIHFLGATLALIFLVFCLIRRKFGRLYEVLLHAHLLSILLMGLTTLFLTMYLPLTFLQSHRSLEESMHYLVLFVSALIMLGLQFIQRNLVEQMLPWMEATFE